MYQIFSLSYSFNLHRFITNLVGIHVFITRIRVFRPVSYPNQLKNWFQIRSLLKSWFELFAKIGPGFDQNIWVRLKRLYLDPKPCSQRRADVDIFLQIRIFAAGENQKQKIMKKNWGFSQPTYWQITTKLKKKGKGHTRNKSSKMARIFNAIIHNYSETQTDLYIIFEITFLVICSSNLSYIQNNVRFFDMFKSRF